MVEYCFPVSSRMYSEEKMITEKEHETVAEEASVEGELLARKRGELGRKDQEPTSGKGSTKFQNPKLSEPTHCCN